MSLSCCIEKESPLCRIITTQEATLLWTCVIIRYTDPRICCGILGSNSHYRALQEKLPYRQNIEIARRVFHHKFHHTRFRRLHPSVFHLPTHIVRFSLPFLTPSRLYLDFSHPFILYFYVLINFTQRLGRGCVIVHIVHTISFLPSIVYSDIRMKSTYDS